MSPTELWRFFPLGYLFSILIETPVLLIGLSTRHPIRRRLWAGIWLTACTYPIVVLVLPLALANFSRTGYLVVAEVFAPVAECILFWLAYGESEQVGKASMWRDFITIIIANRVACSTEQSEPTVSVQDLAAKKRRQIRDYDGAKVSPHRSLAHLL